MIVYKLLHEIDSKVDLTDEFQTQIDSEVLFKQSHVKLLIGKKGSGKTCNL